MVRSLVVPTLAAIIFFPTISNAGHWDVFLGGFPDGLNQSIRNKAVLQDIEIGKQQLEVQRQQHQMELEMQRIEVQKRRMELEQMRIQCDQHQQHNATPSPRSFDEFGNNWVFYAKGADGSVHYYDTGSIKPGERGFGRAVACKQVYPDNYPNPNLKERDVEVQINCSRDTFQVLNMVDTNKEHVSVGKIVDKNKDNTIQPNSLIATLLKHVCK